MFCGECGKELKDTEKFCRQCGTKVDELEPTGVDDVNEDDVNEVDAEIQLEDIEDDLSVDLSSDLYEEDEWDDNNDGEYEGDNGAIGAQPQAVLKKYWKQFIAAAVVFVLTIAGTSFYRMVNQYESIIQKIDQTIVRYDDYITTDFADQIDQIKVERTALETKKKLEDAKLLFEKASQLEKEIIDKNEEVLKIDIETLRKGNTTLAYDDELQQISEFQKEIDNDMKDKQYRLAEEVAKKWRDLLDRINVTHDNYELVINQIDTNGYPKVKLYLSVIDKNTGKIVKDIDSKFIYLSEKMASDATLMKQTISKFTFLDEKEPLNINLVADVSDSMEGYPLDSAKHIMMNFLNTVQFSVADQIELTIFADYVNVLSNYTSDKNMLLNQISDMNTSGMTALYDALFAAVNSSAAQGGAKCVIAFTDGQDNMSKISPSQIIEYAKRYKVPIFIVGIGDSVDTSVLEDIASQSNGRYQHISDIESLSNFYDTIYRKNKEMYVLEYQVEGNQGSGSERNIEISLQTRENGGKTEFAYSPIKLISENAMVDNGDPMAYLLKNYLYNYITAINNHDYSYIQDYLVSGGGVEKEVKPYIQKNIKEELLAFEITNENYVDGNTCIVTTRETYKIQNTSEPLHMRVLQGMYEIEKQSNGQWKIKNFAGKYKILSKINY